MSSWHSHVQWHSNVQCQQVSTGGAWWQCDRISVCAQTAELIRRELLTGPGRRIKGGGLLPGWVKLPVRVIGGASPPRTPPPVLVIVSDILDSEIHDRTRVLYSYSYLRGSYEIEADLTMH